MYPGPKQYNSKAALWDAIKSVRAAITPEEIQNLTASMDNRLFTVIEQNGAYIGMYELFLRYIKMISYYILSFIVIAC